MKALFVDGIPVMRRCTAGTARAAPADGNWRRAPGCSRTLILTVCAMLAAPACMPTSTHPAGDSGISPATRQSLLVQWSLMLIGDAPALGRMDVTIAPGSANAVTIVYTDGARRSDTTDAVRVEEVRGFR